MFEQPRVTHAYLDDVHTLYVKLSAAHTQNVLVDEMSVTDQTTGADLPVASVHFYGDPANPQTDLLVVTLAETPDVTHVLEVVLRNHGGNIVVPRNVLNGALYYYDGDDLGCAYTPDGTAFRVWTPTASDVHLLLYRSEMGPLIKQVPMECSDGGTWFVRVEGNLVNWYYLYLVTIHGVTHVAVDPYARTISVNAHRAMIVDMATTNPAGWEHDQHKQLASPVDAVIYEVHVRDFSIEQSSGMQQKGRYLAFTEEGTRSPEGLATGIDHLKELGITHVQVLPVEEFASVDEYVFDQYNWGYDPRNYNVPEGAYATTPHGTARIAQYKQMIQNLHKANIGVIMDVVYNHTYAVGDSDFDKLVPQYYYRTDYAGNYTNGSGVGNEVASERPMVQKFIRDSLKYWVEQYHVDGFRFDLMALLGVETMQKVAADLHALNPSIMVYGEPWTGGGSALPGEQLLMKGRQRGLGIGVFNDEIRDALDGTVFDAGARGFATGAQGALDAVRRAMMGSIDDFAAAPSETINYVSCHDNYTLWDKIAQSNGQDSEADRIKMDELAQAVILTSQGVPFLQGGEEFLRTKSGNNNSYNAGDEINQFDWSRKASYKAVCDYYMQLIHVRLNHPAFRLRTTDEVREHLSILSSPNNTLAFELHEHANGDPWAYILVIYNPNLYEVSFALPAGTWTLVGTQGHVSEEPLGQVEGMLPVPPIACMILHQEDGQRD